MLLAAAVLLLANLGATDLWAPDEPRYAAVAEELRSFRHGASGLALLHLNDTAYTQKPPLYFWLAALAGVPAGAVSEASARLPSALSGIAAVLLLARFGGRMLGAASGLLGGAFLLTAFEFAHRARRVQLDVLLTLLEMIALIAFWRIESGAPKRRRDLALLHVALGLAVLTKGPVGFLVPALVIVCTLGAERRWADLRALAPAWALSLSLGPGLAWTFAMLALAPSGTFESAIGTNLFGRFFSGTSHARSIGYFFYQFPVNFLPWTLLWPLTAWVGARQVFAPGGDPDRRRAWRFLLLWVGVSFVFFSLSSGKRGLYLLPAFPAAALLCADAVVLTLATGRDLPRWVQRGLAAAAGLVPAAALAATWRGNAANVEISAVLGAALAAVAVGAVLAWRAAGARAEAGIHRVGIVAAAIAAVELCVFTLGFPALDDEKSPRPVALAAAALTTPEEFVGLASRSTLLGGLVFYAGRPIRLLEEPSAVEEFFDRGGRVIVVPEIRLEDVARIEPVTVRARFRSGRRSLLVVSPAAED